MEIDLSKKAGYFIKYGVAAVIALALVISFAVFSFMNKNETLIVHDAAIAGTFVSVKARAPGKIQEISVEDGAFVKAGDPLATIEVSVTEETLNQLKQNVELANKNLEELKKGHDVVVPVSGGGDYSGAQADLSRAEARKDRMEELYKMGAISQVKRNEAVADYEAAKARAAAVRPQTYQTVHHSTSPEIIENAALAVRQAEMALKRAREDAAATEILSPVDGAFFKESAEVGVEVQAGMRLFNIGDAANMWIEARLSPEDIKKIRMGGLVSYKIAGEEYTGTVTEIEESAEQTESEPKAMEGGAPQEETDGKRVVKISLNEKVTTKKPGTPVEVIFKL
ncbi:MAG: HlyD family efflux transporter periplasmic adaptor subunit [Selenomonadaceae bacterium]|nr:HlyD family efflux transporter periplasmic adaptor subunit [Selenomonadaceae bacterium]MBR3723283.1 HlyD family efflux transporter periplasmic adaptor subunit [Selenomonadaceae bacterium]